jgi:hypothetical protein
VRRHCHFFVALFAIALQALDVVVGSFGHSHTDSGVATTRCDRHDAACSHHHHDAQKPALPDDDQHDDCSLCRHFSQAAAPVAVTIELVGSERVEPFASALVALVVAAPSSIHLARGPPAFCA